MSSEAVMVPAETAAGLRALLAARDEALRVAERQRMRLEGAKAALMDADDALQAALRAAGLDTSVPLRLHDDGTVTQETTS